MLHSTYSCHRECFRLNRIIINHAGLNRIEELNRIINVPIINNKTNIKHKDLKSCLCAIYNNHQQNGGIIVPSSRRPFFVIKLYLEVIAAFVK